MQNRVGCDIPGLRQKQSTFVDVKDLPLMNELSKEQQDFLGDPEFNSNSSINANPSLIISVKLLVNEKTNISISTKYGYINYYYISINAMSNK